MRRHYEPWKAREEEAAAMEAARKEEEEGNAMKVSTWAAMSMHAPLRTP